MGLSESERLRLHLSHIFFLNLLILLLLEMLVSSKIAKRIEIEQKDLKSAFKNYVSVILNNIFSLKNVSSIFISLSFFLFLSV